MSDSDLIHASDVTGGSVAYCRCVIQLYSGDICVRYLFPINMVSSFPVSSKEKYNLKQTKLHFCFSYLYIVQKKQMGFSKFTLGSSVSSQLVKTAD